MLFNSISYLLFLPVAVLLYYLLPSTQIRNIWLLAGSYYFYMKWNAAYSMLLFAVTIVTYMGGLILSELKESDSKTFYRKLCLILCVSFNLGILCVFKYSGMIVNYSNRFLSITGLPQLSLNWDLILPVGISFFTLQSLGYLIDVYRGSIVCERNLITYALFVSFFPQLVAGPIERSKNLLTQLKKRHILRYESFQKGIYWILYGLMIKMVIADNLAVFVDVVYADPVQYPGWYIIAATLAFTIQIYCDFYGYSIIAKGSACLFGIDLMSNFEAPYYSKSIKEYWRRWHISLSTWFRDYLYIPLGGNRKGFFRNQANILIVFLVSGLWHGAAFTYVFWGLLNGLYQIIGNLCSKISRPGRTEETLFYRRAFKTGFTFLLVAVTFIVFRAYSWSQAKLIFENLFLHIDNYKCLAFENMVGVWGVPEKVIFGVFFGIGILSVIDYQKYHKKMVIDCVIAQDLWFRYLVIIVLVLLILMYGCYGETHPQQFIYFQF